MAEVFQAKAFGLEGFERIVAVKRILPAIAEDKEFISMFIDEAKIAVQLNHANICQVFDLGKVEESYFIALEYVSGRDVRSIFDRCKQRLVDSSATMPIAQACFVVMKVCEGLDYAHNKKDSLGNELHLVHRDVSPQNIIISYEGEVKLIDFGIAKAAGKGTVTQAGILKGKFGYMSPEQVRGQDVDRRSDIFALGIVLYELLTGERLFVGESDFSTLEKVRNVEIVPPTTYNRKIPEELERIVLKALAREVDERYQSTIDLHDDLQAFMYTSGEFYSRKDLSNWMKRVFRAEMEEERGILDAFRDFKPGSVGRSGPDLRPKAAAKAPSDSGKPSSWTPERPKPSGASPPPPLPPPPPRISSPPAAARQATPAEEEEESDGDVGEQTAIDGMKGKIADFAWDEEELETHVYEGSMPSEAAAAHAQEEREESPREPTPAPAEEEPARPPSSEAPTVSAPREREQTPAPRSGVFTPGVAEGPIRTGVPSRSVPLSRTVLAAIGAGLVLVVGTVAYVLLSGRTGELILVAEPSSGVSVLVNQRRVEVAETPARLRLQPGTYQVSVQHEGYLPWNETVQVRAGETSVRNARLESVAAKTGGFTIISDPPGAKAMLDGQELGQITPMKVQSVMPGPHALELRLGQRVWRQEVTLEAGKILDVRATLPAPPAPTAVAATPPERPPAEQRSAPPTQVKEPAPPHDGQKRTPASAPPVASASKPSEDKQARRSPERPERPAGSTGFLRVNSKPWTKIAVDGSETGLNTPQTSLKLSPGEHRVTLSNPQFNVRETFTVNIRAGETVTVIKDLLGAKD